jgi:serine/threonine protein kinase, bacterial
VAVDPGGNVYVVNDSTVVKVAAGSNTQTVLPFTGLKEPWAVAVDTGGNVYVSDQDNKRVLELAGG